MLSDIIKPEDCASCGFCCKFTNDNIWDVPLFTETQKSPYPHISFEEYGRLWTPLLIQALPFYICPFLDVTTGCVLKENKPFDCDLWPFYVMKKDEKDIVVLCDDCPTINNADFKNLLSVLFTYRDKIQEMCLKEPDYIREYKNDYKIVFDI